MIDVLLATCRPNKVWMEEQIDSIRAQRDVETSLIIRDDADMEGPCANFNALLKMSTADYAAFSDQDDVWDQCKLAKMMSAMAKMESDCGRDMPILVFCDSFVTDTALHRLPGRFMSRRGINVKSGMRIERLLMQNFIPGNTMLLNAALREKVGDIPDGAIMHDYWVALVAASFGRIAFVDEPLVLYRQHGGNVISADARSGSLADFKEKLRRNVLQAKSFLRRYGEESPGCVQVLARIDERSWFGRRFAILRHGLLKQGLLRNLGVMAVI